MSQSATEIEAHAAGAPGGLSLAGVTRVLGGRPVLDGLSLDVPAQTRVGIVGRSGAGKSTLLSLVAGHDDPDEGVVTVAGASTRAGRLARCVLMSQRDCLLPWRSAIDNACLALENRGLRRGDARRQAVPLFERLGLAGAEGLRPSQLSGGMRQRVALARTLLSGKDVLLLDEPFGALDAITRAELQEWLLTVLADEPRTVALVTHDVEEALLLCDAVVVLRDGRIRLALEPEFGRNRPRRAIVTSHEFVELRERALEAIG